MRAPGSLAATSQVGRYLDRWHKPVLLGLAVLNFVLIIKLLSLPDWRGATDWHQWLELPPAGTASPYGVIYRWSPVAVYLFQPLAVALGPLGFLLAHFVALLALPRRVGLVVALSLPFWVDMLWGNLFTFVVVAAFWAMRGSRSAVLTYFALTLLMPRPVQLPLLAWLLWQEPWSRLPFAMLFVGHAVLVLATGLEWQWLAVLASGGGQEAAQTYNFGPSRLLGPAWLLVGIPVGLWLFRRNPAWAGLALSPYLLGQYWLFAFLGWRPVALDAGVEH